MTKGWRNESGRHSLAARGIRVPSKSVARALDFKDGIQVGNVKVPPLLYHGTSFANLNKILDEGLKVNAPHSCTSINPEYESDCEANISFANKVQDACFFASSANMSKGDIRGSQAILEIDMTQLPENPCARRPLFDKKGHYEYKFFTYKNIPPSAIKRVLVRDMKPFKETWYTVEELRKVVSR